MKQEQQPDKEGPSSIFGPRPTPRTKRRRREIVWGCTSAFIHFILVLTVLACFVLTILGLIAPAALGRFGHCDHVAGNVPAFAFYAASATLSAPGPLWLVLGGRKASWHLCLASAYATVNWLCQITFWQAQFWRCHPVVELYTSAFQALAGFSLCGTLMVGTLLAEQRLRSVEKVCLVDLRTRYVRRCLQGFLVLVLVFCICVLLGSSLAGLAVVTFMTLLGWVIFFFLVLFKWRAVRMAGAAKDCAPEDRRSQAAEMHRALRSELAYFVFSVVLGWGTILSALDRSEILVITHGKHQESDLGLLLLFRILGLADALCNQWYALHLSGASSGAVRGTKARAVAAKKRRAQWHRAKECWAARWQQGAGQEEALWDEKVLELAQRGVSLEALLHFYGELPQLMPHYDAARSTTNDVVRSAIVPFSAKEQTACASILMGGEATLPDKMVTHNWSNLFRDLLAAIVADALGENEFFMVSALLMGDLDRLKRWVANARVGGRTYWVCAFAVNQHAGICNSVTSKDTVTGLVPPACECGLKKCLNETEPQLADGRGIPCEMNKFDDMMKLLSERDPSFEQVLAIDKEFGLFSRAWCVAEIATANGTGMTQRLKIHSLEAFSKHEQRLHGLKIQDMKASRAADKEAILASINDLDKFNENLQVLLFKQLFPAWTSLDAEERMAKAGAVIRWLPVWADGTKLEA